MALIDISNLTFGYDGSSDNVFENVSFRIDTNWRLGFTGRNGRGKTTFLKLLQGEYEYNGTISAQCDFSYFPFEVENGALNALEIAERIYPGFEQWELMRELNLLEVSEDTLYRPFDTLSGGERTKIMLAVLFLKQNNFLLIDEPTNHLDMHGREVVRNYLNGKRSFILVSHDRDFLDGCVDHILSINRADIEVRKGSFSSWLIDKERRDNLEASENERLKKDVKRLSEAAKRTASWSESVEKTKYATRDSGLRPDRGYIGHKSAKMMKRAKSIENRRQAVIDEKSTLLKNVEISDTLKIEQLPYHAGRLMSLKDVSIYYGDVKAAENVSFTVEKGARIALLGKNGSGKSSVLKLLCGQEMSYTGELLKGSGLLVSYVPQTASHLCGSLSDYASASGINESLFKAILRKLGFSREQFDKNIEVFSEGQKKKTLIAKSLCEKAHLLVWDEPLNYIDIISRMQIEELLLEFKPTILFVEHDKVFCDKIATETVFL